MYTVRIDILINFLIFSNGLFNSFVGQKSELCMRYDCENVMVQQLVNGIRS